MKWWKIKTAASGVKGTTGADYADYQGSGGGGDDEEKGKRLCSYSMDNSFFFHKTAKLNKFVPQVLSVPKTIPPIIPTRTEGHRE